MQASQHHFLRSTLTLAALLTLSAPAHGAGPLMRANTTADGSQVLGTAAGLSFSRDGRMAAFASNGALVPPGNDNGWTDVFVKDLKTGAIVRASTSAAGVESDATCAYASLSGDGRSVAFYSIGKNLTADVVSGSGDVFVKNLDTGAIALASSRADGIPGDGPSYFPALSADGRHVAFLSFAANLVPDDTNNTTDVFVKNLVTGELKLVSAGFADGKPATGTGRPTISADGRYVAFASYRDGLVADDTNGVQDVFVADTQTGALRRVSVTAAGVEGNLDSAAPAISKSGRWVAFQSAATTLAGEPRNRQTDIFVKDLSSGDVTLVSVGLDGDGTNGASIEPAMSGDGRFVAFRSAATNLVAGDTNGRPDVFVVDRTSGATTRVSVGSGGAGNKRSSAAAISADGKVVGFESESSNLVPDDTNGALDVFVGRR